MISSFSKIGGALLSAAFITILFLQPAHAEDKQRVHQVMIQKFKFVPDTLTIRKGDQVVWVNQDFAPHTATEKNDAWDTDRLNKNESFKIDFSAAGEIDYFCRFHPNMRGKIIVSAD